MADKDMKWKTLSQKYLIEKGEDPMAAAKRELMEETGFGGGNWQKWMTISANPSTHTNLSLIHI